MKVCLRCRVRFDHPGWRCPACRWEPLGGDAPLFAPEFADAHAGYEPGLSSALARIEHESFWFSARNRLIEWAVRRYYPDARSMLEIGCGGGFVLAGLRRSFPDLGLTGCELLLDGLRVARGRLSDATLVQADARDLPWAEEFDLAGAFDVLEHVREDDLALGAIRETLRPGGGLLVTVPQHPRLWSAADEFWRHERRYTRRELTRKLDRAGFRLVRATSFVSLLLPAMAVARARRRRATGTYDPAAEFPQGRVVNAALGRVMDAERILVRSGVSFPAGGSLLVIATRA